MKHSTIYLLLFLLSLAFSSCSTSHVEVADWGKTKSYSDFLWKHYASVKMEQTLVLEFNDDAKRLFTGRAVFQLALKTKDGQLVPTDELLLYKNGRLCKDNKMTISRDDNEITVGVEFKRTMPEGCYTLFLTPIETGGLDRIENIDLQNGFNVQKIDIMNPLAKISMYLFSGILILILVWWLVISRIINPNLKFSRISFDYNDGIGEISRRVGSCYKILCTNKPVRISLFHKIFVGNVCVEVNEFWNEDLTVRCGSRNMIRLTSHGDYLLPDEPVRKEMFSVGNSQNKKVNIETT